MARRRRRGNAGRRRCRLRGVARGHALDALAYHADRPLQVESPYGAALLIARLFKPDLAGVDTRSARTLVAGFEPAVRGLAAVLSVSALLAVYWVYARGAARTRDEAARLTFALAAASAALIAFIALGKVFSPQYLTWLLPLAVIPAALGSERSRVLLIPRRRGYAGRISLPLSDRQRLRAAGPGAVALFRDGLLIGAGVSLLVDAARGEAT